MKQTSKGTTVTIDDIKALAKLLDKPVGWGVLDLNDKIEFISTNKKANTSTK